MKYMLIVLSLVSALLIASCASIFTGTSANVSISSTPTKADVVIETRAGLKVMTGETPMTTKLSRKNEYTVTIKLDGYKEQKISIDHTFNGWYLGNLICGGIIGLIIDAVDGAIWKLNPTEIKVTLVTAALNGKTTIYAVLGAIDDQGQLRTLAVPLLRETN